MEETVYDTHILTYNLYLLQIELVSNTIDFDHNLDEVRELADL